MVLFNYSTKEITAKIVYYGPGLCGKTTNLQFIYESLPGNISKGKMLSLATKTDRTLFFDFLPIDLGTIRGMRTRLQLYTVPGQVFYNTTRKLVLKGADGVVFVADSQKRMLEANLESFRNLEENLAEHDLNLAEMPLIIQFNKRDLPDVMSVEELNEALNKHNSPIYEAVATTGIGVHETLKASTRLVLNSLKERYADKREQKIDPSMKAAAMAAVATRDTGESPRPRTGPAAAPQASVQAMPVEPSPPTALPPEPTGSEPGAGFEESPEASFADLDLEDAPLDLGSLDEDEDRSLPVEPDARPVDTPDQSEEPLLLEVVGEPGQNAGEDEDILELVLDEPDSETEPSAEPLVWEDPDPVTIDAPTSAPEPPFAALPGEPSSASADEFFEEEMPRDEPLAADPDPVWAMDEPPLLDDEPELAPEPASPWESSAEDDAVLETADVEEETPILVAAKEAGEASPLDMAAGADLPADHHGPFEEDRSNLDLAASQPTVPEPAHTPTVIDASATAMGSHEIQVPIQLAIGGRRIEFQLRIALDLSTRGDESAPGGTEVNG